MPRERPPVDPIDRAHLTGWTRPTPPITRYPPAPELTALVQRYWIPVWSLPAPSTQRTLQHPSFLVVISNTYARFYGVSRGLSSVVLDGDGWAVGTMLTPAAGGVFWPEPATELVDRHVDLGELPGLDADALVTEVHAAMDGRPQSPAAHQAAIDALERRYRARLPVDPDGVRATAIVDWLREHPEVTRVSDLAAAFGVSARTLGRWTERRIGLSPKWLIQRRRLHDVVERLKAGTASLAAIAAELGYADQAHLTHDFRQVTQMTPGEYLADQRPGPPPVA